MRWPWPTCSPAPTPTGGDRLDRRQRAGRSGVRQQPRPARVVRRRRRPGFEGRRRSAAQARCAPPRTPMAPQASAMRSCRPPTAAADRLRRRAGVDPRGTRASGRIGRPGHRAADQPGTGTAGRTGPAPAVAATGHHGRRIRLPRKHHAGGRVEHQCGPRGRRRGVRRVGRRMGQRGTRTPADHVGAQPDRARRDDTEDPGPARGRGGVGDHLR